jgi:hypothetical protein
LYVSQRLLGVLFSFVYARVYASIVISFIRVIHARQKGMYISMCS